MRGDASEEAVKNVLSDRQVFRFKNHPRDEQDLIRYFFNNQTTGFYVDVGANHPTIQSQSYHLEQIGWAGILVEPLPDCADLLRQQRNGIVVQAACSNKANHHKELDLVVAGGHSTLNNVPIALASEGNGTIKVQCRTLDSILEENNVPTQFEFLSIDIEGHELDLFDGFDLNKWQPSLILLEDHVVSHDKHKHLQANDYQLIMRTGLNSWYVPASENYKLSWPSRFEQFRKYWLGLYFRKLRYRK